MTKTNFEAIAAILAKRYDDLDSMASVAAEGFDRGYVAGGLQELTEIVDELADYFESVNPRFDRDQFLTAAMRIG